MLHIIPIQYKSRQEEFAKIFSVSYEARAFAYVAVDDEIDGKVNSLIGFMQFTVCDGYAEVVSLTPFEDVEDDEAMQIMARTAFAFVHRIGTPEIRVPKSACGEGLMKLLRMEDRGDVWVLDLAKYFAAKCSDR